MCPIDSRPCCRSGPDTVVMWAGHVALRRAVHLADRVAERLSLQVGEESIHRPRAHAGAVEHRIGRRVRISIVSRRKLSPSQSSAYRLTWWAAPSVSVMSTMKEFGAYQPAAMRSEPRPFLQRAHVVGRRDPRKREMAAARDDCIGGRIGDVAEDPVAFGAVNTLPRALGRLVATQECARRRESRHVRQHRIRHRREPRRVGHLRGQSVAAGGSCVPGHLVGAGGGGADQAAIGEKSDLADGRAAVDRHGAQQDLGRRRADQPGRGLVIATDGGREAVVLSTESKNRPLTTALPSVPARLVTRIRTDPDTRQTRY